MSNRRFAAAAAATSLLLGALAACSTGQAATSSGAGSADPLSGLDAATLVPAQIVAKGPNGETSADPATLALSDDAVAKVKAAKIKVGVIMQTMDIEWSTEQVRGITDEVTKLGGTVVGVCNGSWAVEKQSACV